MELPKRKQNRLGNYDYSQNGAYFITICTKDRKPILSKIIVGANSVRPQLKEYGIIVEKAIKCIPVQYPMISVDKYVIMPDHIHILLQIHLKVGGRPMVAPTIERVVKQMKGYVSKQTGEPIFQRSFYDHIIRNQKDYDETWEYIENNPKKMK